jgi:hypothetical protein
VVYRLGFLGLWYLVWFRDDVDDSFLGVARLYDVGGCDIVRNWLHAAAAVAPRIRQFGARASGAASALSSSHQKKIWNCK